MRRSDDPIRERQRLFYSSIKWRTCREFILNDYPVCYFCKRNVSEHVHHCLPISGQRGWLYRLSAYLPNGDINLVGTCARCHSKEESHARNKDAQDIRHEDLEFF